MTSDRCACESATTEKALTRRFSMPADDVLEKRSSIAVSAGSNPIRILAVDDHSLLRSGIAALLATQPDMTLVAEASNGHEAIQQFRAHHPDITLMDLQMPEMSGLDALTA